MTRPENASAPQHYVAGLTLRLDQYENENFYGLSFLRGCAACEPEDGLPDDIVPENNVNLIVLWQQTGNGTSRQWLAYSEVGLPTLFSDGAESEPPLGKWTVANDHNGDPLWVRAHNFAHIPGSYSWTTRPDTNGIYEDPPAGETWNDYLISEAIDLSQVEEVYLTFWTRYQLDDCSDYGIVEICSEGNCTSDFDWTPLNDNAPVSCTGSDVSSYVRYTGNSDALPDGEDGWVKKVLNLNDYAGSSNVKIRFRFERNCCTISDGWWIDDIRVSQNSQEFPVDKSTLLVRIFEGTSIKFNNGGTTPIETDDFITQSNGAYGKVIFPPVSSPAAGPVEMPPACCCSTTPPLRMILLLVYH